MRIYVWGTGCGAGELFGHGIQPEQVRAFIDNAPSGKSFLGRPVITPDQLSPDDAELILVTSRHTESIRRQCLDLGLRPEILLFLKNHYLLSDLNTDSSYSTAARLLGTGFLSGLQYSCHIVREPPGAPDRPSPFAGSETDYVRIKTLELLAGSLREIPGAAAELGVYRGAFARIINSLLPDRKLYLFDSFEGFDEEEALREQQAGTCDEAFLQAHRNTSAQKVLDSMPCPEQVIIQQGFFPETAENLDETFCLVSLDADLEATTYAGLAYFWPRMNSGGYLLLHDYNSPKLSGVKRALQRYRKEQQSPLPGVPLCDVNGTMVLCKP